MPFYKNHILKSIPYQGGLIREQKIIYKMSSNENPLGPSPMALKAVGQKRQGLNEYDFEDDHRLTEKLSNYFQGFLTRDQFLPANSGMELLDLICRDFLDPGNSCIVSSPTFMV